MGALNYSWRIAEEDHNRRARKGGSDTARRNCVQFQTMKRFCWMVVRGNEKRDIGLDGRDHPPQHPNKMSVESNWNTWDVENYTAEQLHLSSLNIHGRVLPGQFQYQTCPNTSPR
jgi:hypothetical protein